MTDRDDAPERPKKRILAEFYQNDGGTEPVREWLKTLTLADRQAISVDIRKAEYGWPIGMPTCRFVEGGIWEIRTDLFDRIARVLFCVEDGRMVLLHGFVKKTQKAPRQDINTATTRRKELLARLKLAAKRQKK